MTPPTRAEVAGQRIGPYTLVQKLGEGGFGVVYLAERREPILQRVALKVLKPGMDSAAVIARFEQERQALALMDHPNIARVFDAGTTERGLPYFVMEHVSGEPITAYCDRARLTIRQRLELMIPVCEAVQHAHMKGLIHRDLKPSNILVGVGEHAAAPKVIDFGVAKALGGQGLGRHGVHTEVGQFVGTPEYMSPEQADSGGVDIDTRADVYSLGVVLYELLTGLLPFDSESLRREGLRSVARVLREIEPPTPGRRLTTLAGEGGRRIAEARGLALEQMTRLLRAELEWIPLKAMRKERAERYESARALAEDIRNYLEGRPLVAGPLSTLYRVRKFVRRNRLGVLAAGALAVAIAAGVAGTMWFAVRERAQRLRVQERERELLEVTKFQASMLAGVDPQVAGEDLVATLVREAGRAAPGDEAPGARELAMRRALGSINPTNVAQAFIDGTYLKPAIAAIDEQFEAQPVTRAQLLQTIAEIYAQLGMLEPALEAQRRVLALRDEHQPWHVEGIVARANMGYLLWATGSQAEAEAFITEAIERGEAAAARGERSDLAAFFGLLGGVRQAQGQYRAAEALYRRAAEMTRAQKGADHVDTLLAENNIGGPLEAMGRFEEARAIYQRVMERSIALHGEDDLNALTAMNNLAGVLESLGKRDEAEALYRRSLAGRRRVLGDEHPSTLVAWGNMGYMLNQSGKPAEAERILREASEAASRAFGPTHSVTMIAEHNLGKSIQLQGRLEEAVALYRPLLEKQRGAIGEGHPDTLITRNSIAAALKAMGRWDEAQAELEGAAEVAQKELEPGTPIRERLVKNVAEFFEEREKAEPGKSYAARAEEWRQKAGK